MSRHSNERRKLRVGSPELFTYSGGYPPLTFEGIPCFTCHKHGGGYYDRLIAETRDPIPETPIFIGLAFEEQIVDKLPHNKHDQKVDFIITEKRVI